jgi:uncharacterized protein
VALRTDTLDLGGLRLTSGEGRKLKLNVAIEPFMLAGERYPVQPDLIPTRLDVSRTTGGGYALRLRFDASVAGPCMRCLEPAAPTFSIEAREVQQPGGGEELTTPYVRDEVLDLGGWARDALALALPATIMCREDCAGLCAVCGENLNGAEQGHHHDRGHDPRWSKLSEIRFE